jgi:hypothetical protein
MKKSKIHINVLDREPVDLIYNFTAEEVIKSLRDQVWAQREKLDKKDDMHLRIAISELFTTAGILLESISDIKIVREMYTDDKRLLMMFVLGAMTHQANIFAPLLDGLKRIIDLENQTSGGGKATAEIKKNEKKELQEEITRIWNTLDTNRDIEERNRAGIIADRLNITPQTVRRHINVLNIKAKK